MFTAEERDGAVTGAAFTGSHATEDGYRWPGTDLLLAVRGELTPVLDRWTRHATASRPRIQTLYGSNSEYFRAMGSSVVWMLV